MEYCCEFCGDEFEEYQEIIKYKNMYFCDEDCLLGKICLETNKLIYEKEQEEE